MDGGTLTGAIAALVRRLIDGAGGRTDGRTTDAVLQSLAGNVPSPDIGPSRILLSRNERENSIIL